MEANGIQTSKKVNVSDEVYQQILQEIVEKRLMPGDKLPSESELVRQFGVSRVSVRSALQRLAGAGIIEAVNGEGSYVKHLQEGIIFSQLSSVAALENYDLNQIMDFRRGIELVSSELAARNATETEIEELRVIYNHIFVRIWMTTGRKIRN